MFTTHVCMKSLMVLINYYAPRKCGLILKLIATLCVCVHTLTDRLTLTSLRFVLAMMRF